MAAADLAAHIEETLGPIEGGWSETVAGEPLWFKVIRVLDRPVPNAATFLTLGASDVELTLPTGRGVRQELVFSCDHRHRSSPIPALLNAVGEELLRGGKALTRGDILGPAGPLFAGSPFTALYSSLPIFFSKAFATWSGSTPPTVFAWLIPITTVEATFVADQGWSEFESLLEARDPDLLDLDRPSVV
jgi:hypothetical protein